MTGTNMKNNNRNEKKPKKKKSMDTLGKCIFSHSKTYKQMTGKNQFHCKTTKQWIETKTQQNSEGKKDKTAQLLEST